MVDFMVMHNPGGKEENMQVTINIVEGRLLPIPSTCCEEMHDPYRKLTIPKTKFHMYFLMSTCNFGADDTQVTMSPKFQPLRSKPCRLLQMT